MKHDIYKLADQYHLTESDQQLLQAVLEAVEQRAQYSVRVFAAQNYVSPAAVIRLSKKLGYTGYTDMIYRLGFLVRNEDHNKAHTSDINSFIGEIPTEQIEAFLDGLTQNRQRTILVAGTGFCEPLRDFFVRKLLVMGYPTVGTNSYEVYETNSLKAGLMIVISKSGSTDTILKLVTDAKSHGIEIAAFTGAANSPISRNADLSFILLDDNILDDRNLTANYFYARVLILFEYLMEKSLDRGETGAGEDVPSG